MSHDRVLVVGDVINDIIVRPEGALKRGTDVKATIRSTAGGSAANLAAWLAHMGVSVRFAGRVGTGGYDAISHAMQHRGIEPVLARDSTAPTGTLIAIIDPDGERSFLTDRGANLHLSAADLPASVLKHVKHVSISGYSFFAPGPRAAVMGLIAEARRQGITVSVDAASAGFLVEAGTLAFLGWTEGAVVLFANEDEARVLTGETDLEQQMQALGRIYPQVIIKRGALGAVVGDSGGVMFSLPALPAEVIDTTGAGDAFAAGYIAASIRGAEPGAALGAGIEAGKMAVTTMGGQPARHQ